MKLVALSVLLAVHCLFAFSRFNKIALRHGHENPSVPLDITLEMAVSLVLGLMGMFSNFKFKPLFEAEQGVELGGQSCFKDFRKTRGPALIRLLTKACEGNLGARLE